MITVSAGTNTAPAEAAPSQTPAIIGGSVGGFVALAAIAFGILFIYRRQKAKPGGRKELEMFKNENTINEDGTLKAELPCTTYEELSGKTNLRIGGVEILEAPANLNAAELDAIPELGGSEVVEAPTKASS